MRGRPQGRFRTARWQIADCPFSEAASCGGWTDCRFRRRDADGCDRDGRGPRRAGCSGRLGVFSERTKSWVAIASFPSLRAGPEGLRRFRQPSLTKLVDIPNGLCYPSWRNGNHANAGAARGQSGQPKLRNAERPMASPGKPQRRARGGRPLGRGGRKKAECGRGAGPGPVANWGGSGLRQRAFSSAGNHAARAARATRATRAPSATYFIYDKKTRAVRGVVEWGNLRLCSLMFAYVRLLGEK